MLGLGALVCIRFQGLGPRDQARHSFLNLMLPCPCHFQRLNLEFESLRSRGLLGPYMSGTFKLGAGTKSGPYLWNRG